MPNIEQNLMPNNSQRDNLLSLVCSEVAETYIDFFTSTIRNRNTRQAQRSVLATPFPRTNVITKVGHSVLSKSP